jgi:hypothetical protein
VSDNDQPRPQQEREVREGAWQAIQQGAQVFGEIGVGAGGIAAAVKVLGEKLGGGSTAGPRRRLRTKARRRRQIAADRSSAMLIDAALVAVILLALAILLARHWPRPLMLIEPVKRL